MPAILKLRPSRSDSWLEWVREQPSVVSGQNGCIAHHLIDVGMGGGMGTKPSDLFTIPMTPVEHAALHHNVRAWERENGSQLEHWARLIAKADREGRLKYE